MILQDIIIDNNVVMTIIVTKTMVTMMPIHETTDTEFEQFVPVYVTKLVFKCHH